MPSDSAPENKSNAPGPVSPYLHIEGVKEYKWQWVKAATKARLSLREWVIERLNAAADKETGDGTGSGT